MRDTCACAENKPADAAAHLWQNWLRGNRPAAVAFSITVSNLNIVSRRRPTLIQALRQTLERIQEREQLTPDDPALLRLKQSILSSITELEMGKRSDPKAPAA
jgi:hypothetical protein